jgi:drug/metabolite transporter (DMT)-like permease
MNPAPRAGTAYAWMLFGAAAFAVMAVLSRAASFRCEWQIVAFARAGLMLVFALALAVARGVPLSWTRPRTLWVRSLAGSFSLLCTFYAYTHLPAGDASTLINMTPVWVAVLSWPLLGERPTLRIWAAVAVSLVGVILVAQPHFKDAGLGAYAGVASSTATAVVMMSLHRLAGVDPRAIVVHFSVLATAATAVLFLSSPEAVRGSLSLSAGTVVLLLSLGLAGTVGQVSLTRAFARGNPSRVALVGMSQIVFAVLLEVLFLRRAYDPRTFLGMALVIAPTGWILLRRGPPASPPPG